MGRRVSRSKDAFRSSAVAPCARSRSVSAWNCNWLLWSSNAFKRSGLVIVDNLLWSGLSAQTPSPGDDRDTVALRAFNRKFLNHPLLDATIIPLGDGTGIGARIA